MPLASKLPEQRLVRGNHFLVFKVTLWIVRVRRQQGFTQFHTQLAKQPGQCGRATAVHSQDEDQIARLAFWRTGM